MRRYTASIALVLAALCCSWPTEIDSHTLTGRWQSDREPLQPSVSFERTLVFGPGAAVTVDARSWGVYPDQRSSDLSSYTRIIGTFRTDGDGLIIQPEQLVWWDRFYGADSQEHVVTPYPYGRVYSGAHYTIEGNRLTIHYLTYPADAPVPTTATFVRVP